jgi:hypothetical protein
MARADKDQPILCRLRHLQNRPPSRSKQIGRRKPINRIEVFLARLVNHAMMTQLLLAHNAKAAWIFRRSSEASKPSLFKRMNRRFDMRAIAMLPCEECLDLEFAIADAGRLVPRKPRLLRLDLSYIHYLGAYQLRSFKERLRLSGTAH